MNPARLRLVMITGLVASAAILALLFVISGQQAEPRKSASADAPTLPSVTEPPDEQRHQESGDSPVQILPEEELIAAIKAACDIEITDVEIAEWEAQWTQEGIEAGRAEQRRLEAEIVSRLSASSSPEHLHLAALTSKDPVERIELIGRAVAGAPSDPFLAWTAARLCNQHGDVECRLDEWQARLEILDSQNSQTWGLAAAKHLAKGDEDAALEALRRGASASGSSIYWVDSLALAVQALAAGSDLDFRNRTIQAFGIAAGQVPGYGAIADQCREKSPSDADWAYTCMAFGEQLEKYDNSEIAIAMGFALQRIALEAMGDSEQLLLVNARDDARRERLRNLSTHSAELQMQIIMSNPTLFEAYLEKIRAKGEVAAMLETVADVDALLRQRPELACEPWDTSGGPVL